MRSPLWMDEITYWHETGNGIYTCDTVKNVHVEHAEESTFSTVGPEKQSILKVWIQGECELSPGDWIVDGPCYEVAPPRSAFRVAHVAPFTMSGRIHHWEVTAR